MSGLVRRPGDMPTCQKTCRKPYKSCTKTRSRLRKGMFLSGVFPPAKESQPAQGQQRHRRRLGNRIYLRPDADERLAAPGAKGLHVQSHDHRPLLKPVQQGLSIRPLSKVKTEGYPLAGSHPVGRGRVVRGVGTEPIEEIGPRVVTRQTAGADLLAGVLKIHARAVVDHQGRFQQDAPVNIDLGNDAGLGSLVEKPEKDLLIRLENLHRQLAAADGRVRRALIAQAFEGKRQPGLRNPCARQDQQPKQLSHLSLLAVIK